MSLTTTEARGIDAVPHSRERELQLGAKEVIVSQGALPHGRRTAMGGVHGAHVHKTKTTMDGP